MLSIFLILLRAALASDGASFQTHISLSGKRSAFADRTGIEVVDECGRRGLEKALMGASEAGGMPRGNAPEDVCDTF